MDRREFLSAATLGVGLASTSGLRGQPVATASGRSRMQVACCAANFHGFRGGADPLPAIQLIGEMGFDGIELIALAPADLGTIWSGPRLDEIRRTLAERKLVVSRFGVFGPLIPGMLAEEADRRAATLDNFERACAVARELGARQIGFTGWPVPGTNPNTYTLRRDAKPGDKLTMPLPSDLDWDALWRRGIEATRACLARAKAHGLVLCVEPHFHGIPQSAEQFLLLQREIADPALGYLLDTCWSMVQCAYPPLLAKMMAPHLVSVQFRDTDAATRNAFVPFGQGVVDFAGMVETLKAVGYGGFVSLEEVFMKPEVARADAQAFLTFMRERLG
jgi:sugar phosphate isomerase/epimerase